MNSITFLGTHKSGVVVVLVLSESEVLGWNRVSLIRPYSCNTRILPYRAVSCRILSYPAVSCRILPYPAVSCRILPYPAVSAGYCRILLSLPYLAVCQ